MRQRESYFPEQPSVDISICIAMYNEASVVDPLLDRISAEMEHFPGTYELIIADDDSSDDTLDKLMARIPTCTGLRVVQLAINVGQVYAGSAALSVARGRRLIMMDGDLQHDPADLPRFIEASSQRHDLVASYRAKRVETITRRIISWVGNRANRFLTGYDIQDFGSSYRLIDHRIKRAMWDREGLVHFNTPALFLNARNPIEISITQHARHSGSSKWTLLAFILFNMDFVIGSAKTPQLLIVAAIASAMVGVFLYVLAQFLEGAQAASAPVTIALTSFLIVILAVIWREIGRLQKLVKGTPPFDVVAVWSNGGADCDRKPDLTKRAHDSGGAIRDSSGTAKEDRVQ